MISCALLKIAVFGLFAVAVPDVIDSPEEDCDYILKGYDLGASCDYDEDCMAEHSYCRNQQVCECRINFEPGPDGATCVANIGAKCLTKYDCMTLPHSDCQQDVCRCDRDFVPDSSGKKCLPRVKDINGLCELQSQCQASFGDYSQCWGGRCQCMIRYHFLNGACHVTKELNEFCNNDNECYIGSEYTNVVRCKDQRCQCIRGYYVDDYRKCRPSGAFMNTPNISLLSFTIVFILFSFIIK